MKDIIKNCVLYVMVLMPILSFASYGQEASVLVGIEPKETELLFMQPLDINLRIENSSSAEIAIIRPELNRHAPNTIDFYVKAPTDQEFKLINWPDIDTGVRKAVSSIPQAAVEAIQPGEIVNYRYQLHYNFRSISRRKWIFSEAGKYYIKAKVFLVDGQVKEKMRFIDIPKRELFSNDIEVIVKEPESEQALLALSDFGKIENEYLLYQSDYSEYVISEHTKLYKDLIKFLDKHPDSYLSNRMRTYIDYENKAVKNYQEKIEKTKRIRNQENLKNLEREADREKWYNSLTPEELKNIEKAKEEQMRIISEQEQKKRILLSEKGGSALHWKIYVILLMAFIGIGLVIIVYVVRRQHK